MGGANSAERAAEFNTKLAAAVRSHSKYQEIFGMAKTFAEAEEKEEKKSFEPKTFLQQFSDPATKLGLLHLICYGDYLFKNDAGLHANRLNLLKELIENRIFDEINVKDATSGANALHYACNRPRPHPFKFVDNNTDVIQTLLAEGVDFNVQDSNGRTPLMLAVDSMYPGSIKELVGRGASVAPVDKSGQTVFHHFVTHFGTRETHKEIPESVLISILESLSAVASAETKDVAVPNLPTHNDQSGLQIREHYKKQEHAPVPGDRAEPAVGFPLSTASHSMTALLSAIREFALEDHIDESFARLRAAIIKYLVKNGFSFYDTTAFYASLSHLPWFHAKVNGRQYDLKSSNVMSSNPLYEAVLDHELHTRNGGDLAVLARLHRDDAAALLADSKVTIFPRGTLLDSTIHFDSKVFADNNERDAIARANPIVASIVLNHFGFFSFLVEKGGFGTLLTRIGGSRQLTPMHILFGITYNGETSEPLHKYFVDRAIEFAFQVAAKEKFFENNTTFTFATVLAAEAKNPDAKFTPLDVRTDLKNFTAALLGYSPTGKLSANAEDAPVFPARDSHKMTPFINALCSIRKVAMDYVVPVCAELQAAFFNSKSREGIERVFVGEELAPGTLLKLFKTNPISGAAPILPNTTQLQLQGNNNSSDADLAFLASDDSPAFTALEFAECTNWMLSLTNLSGSKKLEGSLERLVFMRCKDVSNSDLELFALDTAFTKPLKLILEGGGKPSEKAVEDAKKRLGDLGAQGGVPKEIHWFPDVTSNQN